MKAIDLTGKRFNRLTVLFAEKERGNRGRIKWRCVCDCGKETTVLSGNFRSTKSCGCYRVIASRERLFKTGDALANSRYKALNRCWAYMRRRCGNPKDKSFKNYGGRGIKVCERWQTYKNFRDDMLPTWKPGLTIERIDVNGNYCPENCKWIPASEQAGNQTTNVRLLFNSENRTIAEWSRITGIKQATLHKRHKDGWSIQDILTKPVRIWPRRKAA